MKDQQDLIKAIKQIPITNYLSGLGIQPQKISGDQFVYFSPFKKEDTPSFYVHPKKNVFNDFSSDIKGDIIRLVRLLHECTFLEALDILKNCSLVEKLPSFSFSSKELRKTIIEVVRVNDLKSNTLINYLLSRKISLEIASQYLKEIDFKIDDKSFFALGFRNSKGGYELRNKGYKGSSSPKYYSLIQIPESTCINIFEGFMDFLSALEYYKINKPRHTTLILNSLSFLDQALIEILSYKKVNAFLDNDNAGNLAFNKIKNLHSSVEDQSYIYLGYKDFNDYWTMIK